MGEGREDKQKPGPGAYAAKHDQVVKQAPKFGFGSGKRDGKNGSKLHVPGPGSYMSKTCVGLEGPRHSMGGQLGFQPHKKE